MKVHRSNRVERLAGLLAGLLRDDPAPPLERETIVVQSRGMERWVSMELAARGGICACCRFPFPNAILDELMGIVVPGLSARSPFDRDVATWEIMSLLPGLLGRREFEEVGAYLRGGGDGDHDHVDVDVHVHVHVDEMKLFQLSGRLADLFDQYAIYRPELVLGWDRGEGSGWQAVLWRELAARRPGRHRAALRARFLDGLAALERAPEGFPRRLSLFAVSSLPPFHVEAFDALSRLVQVHVFLVDPRGGGGRRAPGNGLLASLGAAAGETLSLFAADAREGEALFEDPGVDTLLHALQSDIFHDRPAGARGPAPPDGSIRLHSCHGPVREVEALHDELLALFDGDPALLPRDVVVMTPDIETYAPLVQAVFDNPQSEAMRIPFSIADRGARGEGPLAGVFLALLGTGGGRLGAEEVLSLLETEGVRARFGLSEDDVEKARAWTAGAGVRWGIDEEGRERLGLPRFAQNSWRAGIERMLLGVAMTRRSGGPFDGVLPFDEIEGSDAVALGRFLEFLERLFAWAASLARERTPVEWARELAALADGFFAPGDERAGELQPVRDAIEALGEAGRLSGFEGRVGIDVIAAAVGGMLDAGRSGRGFIARGVTFSEPLPVRAIPFRVVCLLGMNGDAFPRRDRAMRIDLVAREPRPGDRSRRKEDRGLFLDALLAARDRLCVTFTGRSAQDGVVVPPSVVVSELLDALRAACGPAAGAAGERLVVEHRLQPFSPAYYTAASHQGDPPYEGGAREAGGGCLVPRYLRTEWGKLFSYSVDDLAAARRALGERSPRGPFVRERLEEPGEEWRTVSLGRLGAFFVHPVRFLLRERLGIAIEKEAAALEESEPFELDRLARYAMEQELVGAMLGGGDPAALRAAFRAEGRLPVGAVGDRVFDETAAGAASLVLRARPLVAGGKLAPLDARLDAGGHCVTGAVGGIFAAGIVRLRPAEVKPRDRLRAWIDHLALSAARPAGYPDRSHVLGSDGAWSFAPLDADEARATLGELLARYREGLSLPLRFFPRASWAYAVAALREEAGEEKALDEARGEWYTRSVPNGPTIPGEEDDDYNRLCFGEEEPLDGAFARCARDVLGPLLAREETG